MKAFLILAIVLVSCGPASKLRRAQKLIDKAIADGAKVKSDTTWTNIKFTSPAITFKTQLENPNWQDTVYLTGKDSVQVKIKRVMIPGKKETVYVEAKCPEREQEVPCPTGVNQTIKAGCTLWDLIILAIICLLVGTFLGGPLLRTLQRRT